jgi:hypothetical protein
MKNNILLSLSAAVALSGCVAPGGTYVDKQMNIYSGRAINLLPLEITPEQMVEYERLKMQEAERNRAILDGRVNNVRGW